MFPQSHERRLFMQKATPFSDEAVTAVVIGSGFGGSVAALRLGQAGIHTVLLERGRRWSITSAQNTFATYRNPDGRSAWLSRTTYNGVPIDLYTGVLERRDENGITVYNGACVGGGSVVYNCNTYQPSHQQFYLSFNSRINYEEMDKVYYPRVRSIIKPSPMPSDILDSSYYSSSQDFIDLAKQAGLPIRLGEVAINWDIVRQEIAGSKVASAIAGEVFYGMNSGAKNSLDRNYLAQAEQTGYVEILPLHVATDITELPGQGYRVFYNQINESGETVVSKSITCNYLFLAAGSMGTSRLLVKAKAKGTLSRLNDYVGQGWANNGDTFSTISNVSQFANSSTGGPMGAGILEYFDNPYGPHSLTYAAEWNNSDGQLSAIGVSLPSVRGSFAYDRDTDSVKLNWPAHHPGVTKVSQAVQHTCRILEKASDTLAHNDLVSNNYPTSVVNDTYTVHPLGGAVLGQACDLYGRLKGYQRLYVVDGALMPGSTGCANPSFTIAAFAERCLDHIVAEDISSATATLSKS